MQMFTGRRKHRGTDVMQAVPGQRVRRTRTLAMLERLEDRSLMAILDVTGGALSYTAAAGVANNVILSTTPTTLTLSDSADTIALTATAMAAGRSGLVDAPMSGADKRQKPTAGSATPMGNAVSMAMTVCADARFPA